MPPLRVCTVLWRLRSERSARRYALDVEGSGAGDMGSDRATRRRPNGHQVNRAARHFVAAELHRRGAEDVVIGTKRGEPDLRASNQARDRNVIITVKAKTVGDWQPSIDSGGSP